MVYVGSKARLAKYLVPIIQNIIDKYKIETYVEPFVGGANIIDKVDCSIKLGYDSHQGLIGIYKAVQRGWRPPATITEEDYIKAKQDKIGEPLKSYIGFNGSFGCKYFGGFARGWKPDGTPRSIYAERTRNFVNQIPKLESIKFKCDDYKNLNFQDSVIYCDPPYQNTVKYAKTSFNHEEFWDWIRSQSRDNYIFISEFSAPADFECIWEKERSSSLDLNTGGKKNIEKLFVKSDSSWC